MMNNKDNNYVAPNLVRYLWHTHDKHNTLSVIYICDDSKNLITDSDFENCNGNWKQNSLFKSGIASVIEDKRRLTIPLNKRYGQFHILMLNHLPPTISPQL